jgi:hypothetical protein
MLKKSSDGGLRQGAMRSAFIIVGRASALALTFSLLFTLLGVLAEDAHAPAVMASAPPAVMIH